MNDVEKARSVGGGMALREDYVITLVPGPGSAVVKWQSVTETPDGGSIRSDFKRVVLKTAEERAAFMEGLAGAPADPRNAGAGN